MRAPRHVPLRPREDKAFGGGTGAGVPVAEDAGHRRRATLVDPPCAKGSRACLRLTLLAPDMVEPIIGRRQSALVWPALEEQPGRLEQCLQLVGLVPLELRGGGP